MVAPTNIHRYHSYTHTMECQGLRLRGFRKYTGLQSKTVSYPRPKIYPSCFRPARSDDPDEGEFNVDRAGVCEEQIKASMEKGLMSSKQYEQIKQLKDTQINTIDVGDYLPFQKTLP